MKNVRALLVLFISLSSITASQAEAGSSPDGSCIRHIAVPNYPRLSWFAQLEGKVSVDVEIGAGGKVRSAVASGAHNLLNRAAEENIREWTFCSSQEGLKLRVEYVYRLEGQREHEQSPPRVSLDLPDRVEIVAHPPQPEP